MSKSKNSECVRVVVRCRPMTDKERAANFENVVSINEKIGQIAVRNPRPASDHDALKVFQFDSVYDWNSKQVDLYEETFRPLVDSVLLGFNGTIFAYGQTGTGKTYTMEGVRNNPEKRGVIPNAFEHIFTHISCSQNQQYLVRASYLEIYQEEVRDLLVKDQSQRLELKEKPDRGVFVKGLSTIIARNVREIEGVMSLGNKNRSVGSTNMNEHSSRSHAILVVTIEYSELGPDGENHIRVGKLNLVDLAGSERQSKTGNQNERLKESSKINLSLSALGNVISALVDGKSKHIPYRDSKLTRLLQDSLGGNGLTVMVANIGPASYNAQESLTTLRYASRAKNIKNKPCINEDPKNTLLRKLQEEIARLKDQLEKQSERKKRKKQRRLEEGSDELETNVEIIEDAKREDEDEGKNIDYWQEQQEKLENERIAIMEDHSLVAMEKEQLLMELGRKMDELMKEKEATEMLAAQVKDMESKLLVGGKNIVDHTNEQQMILAKKRQEIAEQKRHEHEIKQEVQYCDEERLELKETYSSLQQEVDIKTKKLKKLFHKLELVTAEIDSIQEDHITERQDLEMMQNKLTKELKLKHLIIENFIPPEQKNKITRRATLDDKDDTWKIKPVARLQDDELMTLRSTMMARPDPINRPRNVLMLELDMPTKTSKKYEKPVITPKVAAALKNALSEESEVEVDASCFSFSSTRRPSAKINSDHNGPSKKVAPHPAMLQHSNSVSWWLNDKCN